MKYLLVVWWIITIVSIFGWVNNHKGFGELARENASLNLKVEDRNMELDWCKEDFRKVNDTFITNSNLISTSKVQLNPSEVNGVISDIKYQYDIAVSCLNNIK